MSDADLLTFLLAFLVLLVAARVLGLVFVRLGQPSVIGELLAGIVLGPTLLGAVAPRVSQTLFPSKGTEATLLQLIAELGVIFLLLLSGMETDLGIIRRQAGLAAIIAALGMIVPFVAGVGLGVVLPGDLLGKPTDRLVFVLFVATAISLSAIPVIVKILLDLDLMRRDIGQLILAAGMLTDTSGWFLLAIVAGIAAVGSRPASDMVVSLVGVIVLAAFTFTVGPRLLRRLLAGVDLNFEVGHSVLSAVVAITLVGAALTQALHVEAFLGAFLVGVQLAGIPRIERKVRPPLEAVTFGIFAPIFFATAGLKVELLSILAPRLLGITLVVIAVAFVGKFVGTYVGGRLAGMRSWAALALGAGLNARGAVEIIVAAIGLALGILTPAMYSIVVVMAVVTSILAPPLLRFTLKRVPMEPEEQERLKMEKLKAGSFLPGVSRILAPVRDGRYTLKAVELLGKMAVGHEIDVVVAHVATGEEEPGLPPSEGKVAQTLGVEDEERPVEEAVEWQMRVLPLAENSDVVGTVLAEARQDYDLIVLGASRHVRGINGFGDTIDRLLAGAPCPAMVVYFPKPDVEFTPRRIVLPTQGTPNDLLGAEFAVALAKGTGAQLLAIHIVEMNPLVEPYFGTTANAESRTRYEVGQHAMSSVRSLGELMGVAVRTEIEVKVGEGGSRQVLSQASSSRHDLIVVTAQRRSDAAGLFLGSRIEYFLSHARCPVVVIFPSAAHGIEIVQSEAA